MEYSEYIVYIDESGDHCLLNNNPDYPVFVLVFCIFQKNEYIHTVVPKIQQFKFRHFGHDNVVLHERSIRKQEPPFAFLQNIERREIFLNDLNNCMREVPMTVIATVINKTQHKEKYSNPANPYPLALRFCMERLQMFLKSKMQERKHTHLIFECRGKAEDRDLEIAFHQTKDGIGANFEMVFADKKTNSTGLQLADVIARPIGIKQLRPNQSNRAYDIIETKFHRNTKGIVKGCGLKCFP